ncbi:hypothetical protein ACFPOH_16525, partial [Ureibacillus suwonensis]
RPCWFEIKPLTCLSRAIAAAFPLVSLDHIPPKLSFHRFFDTTSTGVFYYPVEQAAKVAVKTVQKYMDENPDAFDLVMWVLFDDNTYGIYSEMIQ